MAAKSASGSNPLIFRVFPILLQAGPEFQIFNAAVYGSVCSYQYFIGTEKLMSQKDCTLGHY